MVDMLAPVPLYISLEPLARNDDVLEHTLRVGVVGDAPPTEATITSEFYERPRVTDCCPCRGVGLDGHLRDTFLIACFELAAGEMRERHGSAGDWMLSDVTQWVQGQFPAREAAVILSALRRQVTPGLHVRDVVTVRID